MKISLYYYDIKLVVYAMWRMKQLIPYIIRVVLGIIPVLWMGPKVSAQIVINECETMEFSVTSRPGIDDSHFVWAVFTDSTVNFVHDIGAIDPAISFEDGQYAGRSVRVKGLDPGRYWVRILVWDEVSCTNNIELYKMDVVPSNLEIQLEGDSVCIGDPPVIKVIFTGVGPYEISYSYGDALTGTVVNVNGVIVDEPEYSIPITDPLPAGEFTFWIMEVSDDCKVTSYETSERPSTGIKIYPKPSNSKIYVTDD